MLELRLLLREWKGGQLSLIAASLILAVSVVASVAIVAERVEGGLSREVSSFLASDIMLRSDTEIPLQYSEKAHSLGLNTAEVTRFNSMVFHGDSNHLSSVKAVSDLYPLRGALTLTTEAFAPDTSSWELVSNAPKQGEAWVEERILPILGMELGDSIEVGELPLKVTRIIINEPDRGSGFSVLGARVMMNHADLDATGVIQPGSRARLSLLAAGEPKQVAEFKTWSEEEADEHLRVVMPENAEERLSRSLDRGQSFLLLSGTVGVLLAAIALALSSQRYAERQKNNIALMKSWGMSSRRIRSILIKQLSILATICTLVGLAAGALIHEALLWTIRDLLPQALPSAGISAYITASMTGFLCLLGFALPAMWHLPAIAPLRVLRRDIDVSALSFGARFVIGLLLLVVILIWYSSSVVMAAAFLGGAIVVSIVLGGLGMLMMCLFKSWASKAGSVWRLSVGNLWRRKWQTIIQMISFSLTIMLLLVMVSMRTSLLNDWQMQIPEGMPNHFLVNVASWEVEQVDQLLEDFGLNTEDEAPEWYPMVRGRLVKQNGVEIEEERLDKADGVDREVNLTWTMSLPESNEITAGTWWTEPADITGRAEFSMEEEVAGELGVELGDIFTFSLGGLEVEAELTSLRSVDWNSMQPNFYIIFPDGVLEGFSPNWITSTYLEREDKLFINELLTQFPTVLVVALDEIFNRIRTLIDRVSMGLELMLLMILACGVLVLFAAIATSFDERAQESAILRTLGSSRKLVLGSLCIEFGFMGLMAGFVAAFGAQLAVFSLQVFVFDMELVWYLWIWLTGPLFGALLVGIMGLLRSYPLVTTPPLQSLRALS